MRHELHPDWEKKIRGEMTRDSFYAGLCAGAMVSSLAADAPVLSVLFALALGIKIKSVTVAWKNVEITQVMLMYKNGFDRLLEFYRSMAYSAPSSNGKDTQ